MKVYTLLCINLWHLFGRDSSPVAQCMRIRPQENFSKSLVEVAHAIAGFGSSSRQDSILGASLTADPTTSRNGHATNHHESRLIIVLTIGVLVGLVSVFIYLHNAKRGSRTKQTEDSEISDAGQDKRSASESDSDHGISSSKVKFSTKPEVIECSDEADASTDDQIAITRSKSLPTNAKIYCFDPILSSSDESDESSECPGTRSENLQSPKKFKKHRSRTV
mmetsp:Transcript_30967/g.49839  ORF Transcript_30967/g.49839 Transcript_30967/m.49839 type:complete len:221 (+) Transcript_30967:84-746(+)